MFQRRVYQRFEIKRLENGKRQRFLLHSDENVKNWLFSGFIKSFVTFEQKTHRIIVKGAVCKQKIVWLNYL
jgi:hypothetical protein